MKEAVDGQTAALTGKRFALLMAANDSQYVLKMHGGYFNVFVEALGDGGAGEAERWDMFRVVAGEFPCSGDLHRYDGFVISGSPHDAYADDLWILRLCFLVQQLDAMRKRLLGICFGHQVICRALGGSVCKASAGWDLGITEVSFTDYFVQRMVLISETDGPTRRAKIIELHQDEVLELPEGAKVLASSEKTRVEMYSIGDHILGIQGHPEYSNGIGADIVTRLLNNRCVHECAAEKALVQLQCDAPDREFWWRLCNNFLKGSMLKGK